MIIHVIGVAIFAAMNVAGAWFLFDEVAMAIRRREMAWHEFVMNLRRDGYIVLINDSDETVYFELSEWVK